MELEHRQFFCQKITQIAEVPIDVFIQFIEPSFGLVVRSYLCHKTKGIEAVHLVYLQGMVDLCKQLFVGHEDVRTEQSGDIERLAGRRADALV